MSTIATLAAEARSALAGSFNGTLTGPDDSGYDEARRVYNAMIDAARPDRPLRRRGRRRRRRQLRARHRRRRSPCAAAATTAAGLGICDDGLVIDLSPMNARSTSTPRRAPSRVEGGCTWGDVDHATHAFGLAVPCGIIATTGVGGLTLGGGIGHLTRKCGLTIDNLLAGRRRARRRPPRAARAPTRTPTCSGRSRGGGGNFGVVTLFHCSGCTRSRPSWPDPPSGRSRRRGRRHALVPRVHCPRRPRSSTASSPS